MIAEVINVHITTAELDSDLFNGVEFKGSHRCRDGGRFGEGVITLGRLLSWISSHIEM